MKNQKEKLISPIHLATKRIKYLGINLPKETKNYKTLMGAPGQGSGRDLQPEEQLQAWPWL